MLSQFDSNILQLPTLPGRIFIPQVAQILCQNDLIFFLSVYHCFADVTILNWTTRRLNQSINQDFRFSIWISNTRILNFYKYFVVRCKL